MKKEQHEILLKKIFNRWSIELDAYREIFGNNMPERTDRLGNQLTFPEWVVLSNDSEYNTIGREDFEENVILRTMWFGYPEIKFGCSIMKNEHIHTLVVCPNEESALKIHGQVGFLLDQKEWDFDNPITDFLEGI